MPNAVTLENTGIEQNISKTINLFEREFNNQEKLKVTFWDSARYYTIL